MVLLFLSAIGFSSDTGTRLARGSIMCSVLRIAVNPRMRWITRMNLAILSLLYCITMAFKLRSCIQDSWYTTSVRSVCPPGRTVSVIEIIGDVISAILLVVTPFAMLWDVNLARRPKILILCIFSMNILSAAGGIVHSVFLVPNMLLAAIAGHVQASTDTMICNLLVTGTFVYRIIYRDVDLDETATSDKPLPSAAPSSLTTVDLDHFSSLSVSTMSRGTVASTQSRSHSIECETSGQRPTSSIHWDAEHGDQRTFGDI